MIFTKTIKSIEEEIIEINSDFINIYPIFQDFLTPVYIMMLFLTGTATWKVTHFDPKLKNSDIFKISNPLGIGLLSRDVETAGAPLNESLLSPASNIWICHGGYHFTVLFTEER